MLLDAGDFIIVVLQALDPGRDMYSRDAFEGDVAIFDPGEEIPGDTSIGPARMTIADMGGEEFNQPFGGALASAGNDTRQNDPGGQRHAEIAFLGNAVVFPK